MATKLLPARLVRVGDLIYNNRHPEPFNRWPSVAAVETIAAGRIALHTSQRLFVYRPDDTVLVHQ